MTSIASGPAREAAVPEEGVPIAEAARRSGVSVYTLRYYERAGLMASAPERTTGGSRRYRAEDLEWIRVCTRMRAIGMPVDLIRQYVRLLTDGAGNEAQRLELLESHRDQVATELAELTRHLELIDHKISFYRGQLAAGTAGAVWAPPPDT